MALFLLAVACAAPAWESVAPSLRVANVACGATRTVAAEVALSPATRIVSTAAAPEQADASLNGGLFDVRERLMGPARSGGRDLPRSPRTACEGVLGAAGARIEVLFSCAPQEWMTDVVSGFPALVRDGRALPVRCRDAICRSVDRRSAVGLAPGKLLLVAADAPGLSLRDLADLLVKLGAREALNLDGGGSTALAVSGVMRVRGMLAVPNHVAVVVDVKETATENPRQKN